MKQSENNMSPRFVWETSRMKTLEGIRLESELIPSGNDIDFRKFWCNTHGHVFFFQIQAYSWRTLQVYFFQSPPGIKIRPDY